MVNPPASTPSHPGSSPDLPDSEKFARDVLAVVDSIPPGRVLSYGRVAALLGSKAARQVGRILSTSDADVPSWRVIREDGTISCGRSAIERLAAEGTPLTTSGRRVDMARALYRP